VKENKNYNFYMKEIYDINISSFAETGFRYYEKK